MKNKNGTYKVCGAPENSTISDLPIWQDTTKLLFLGKDESLEEGDKISYSIKSFLEEVQDNCRKDENFIKLLNVLKATSLEKISFQKKNLYLVP